MFFPANAIGSFSDGSDRHCLSGESAQGNHVAPISRKEKCEGVAPFGTYGNTPPSVAFASVVFRIEASPLPICAEIT